MVFRGFSGLKGAELLDEIEGSVDDILKMLDDKLHADSVVRVVYDVITAPEITGLIAHEAFGHGVEMDMFVKERALAKEYVGKKWLPTSLSMKDGAASAAEVSSYLFDDEGTLGTDTTIIKDGTLVTGISDLLSALRLGTTPTGNGKRESFERKAYTRMTNTFFTTGDNTLGSDDCFHQGRLSSGRSPVRYGGPQTLGYSVYGFHGKRDQRRKTHRKGGWPSDATQGCAGSLKEHLHALGQDGSFLEQEPAEKATKNG
ncbi:MAG: metallopeptidase TldD-related protein [Lachnospiraceae bacterium]